jgi:polyhydroxyalkanoate depolymerase
MEGAGLIYQAYQSHADLTAPLRAAAKAARGLLAKPWPGMGEGGSMRRMAAAYELLSRAGLSHTRPAYGIDSVTVEGREVAVEEEVVMATPFGSLLHFKKDIKASQPRVLIVAPMSGHFATLLRSTARTMLADCDVYITDWHNARDIPVTEGKFDLDDFIEILITFLEAMGPGAHMVAVCQPTVAALAATSIMFEDDNPSRPSSLTLMAGPLDARISPTKVNELATKHSLDWFKSHLIHYVPLRHPGAMRRVYPGFLQLAGFMSMNLERHIKTHVEFYDHLVKGEHSKAETIRSFYDEYFAVMDLPAEFFLQTIRDVFQEYKLAKGTLEYRGRKVNPKAIKRMALVTIEGEKDDICAVGQTLAAQEMCSSIRPYFKTHHVQTGVGHYGVFNGRRWQNEIYPILRDTIHNND